MVQLPVVGVLGADGAGVEAGAGVELSVLVSDLAGALVSDLLSEEDESDDESLLLEA
jgi:hypothetical protein